MRKSQKFLKKYKAKFPGILVGGKGVNKLPGFQVAQGIPNAIMVDGEGNVLSSGHPGSVLAQWKQAVENLSPAEEEEPEEDSAE